MKEELKARFMSLKNGLKDMVIETSNRVYSEETSKYDREEADLARDIRQAEAQIEHSGNVESELIHILKTVEGKFEESRVKAQKVVGMLSSARHKLVEELKEVTEERNKLQVFDQHIRDESLQMTSEIE